MREHTHLFADFFGAAVRALNSLIVTHHKLFKIAITFFTLELIYRHDNYLLNTAGFGPKTYGSCLIV